MLLQVAPGEAKQVWRAADTDQGFHCVAWLDESTALIRTNARLLIVDLASGEELSEVRVKSERATVAIGAQGRLVAVARSTGITLYAWQRPKLKRAAVYKHKKLWIASAAGEEVRLRVGLCHLALTGVDDYLTPAKKKRRS